MNTDQQPQTIVMTTRPHDAYTVEDVSAHGMTLGELLEAVQTAIETHGEDTRIVISDPGNRYGAQYGYLPAYGDNIFTTDTEEDDQ